MSKAGSSTRSRSTSPRRKPAPKKTTSKRKPAPKRPVKRPAPRAVRNGPGPVARFFGVVWRGVSAVWLAIAHGVASAAAQLHQRGILHGDLYGHNILHDDNGRCVLSDFGAAAFYAPASPAAMPLQQIEVRAFGLLLDELLERCDAPPALRAQLAALHAACTQAEVGARPLFAAIAARLHELDQSKQD